MDDRIEFTRTALEKKARDCGVPDYMIEGHVQYIVDRVEPGHFLMNVYANDLFGAIGRADINNALTLRQHAQFIYSNAPIACWGSHEKVQAWLNGKEQ